MDTLELSKVEIKSLYHKGDIVFDLKNDCTILIGENGIGKTTALKILQYLITGDFITVGNYIFDKIIITDNEKKHVLRLEDFLIPAARLEELFSYYCLSDYDEKDRESLEDNFFTLLLDLERRELLGRFISETYKRDGYTFLIKKIIEKYLDSDILSRLIINADDACPCYEDAMVGLSDYYKNVVQDRYWRNGVVFGDMLEKIRFPEKGEGFVHFKLLTSNEKELIDLISNDKGLKVHILFDDPDNGTQIEKEHSYDFDEKYLRDILATLIKIQNNEKVTDVHSAIRAIYFEKYKIQELNDVAIEGVKRFFKYRDDEKEYSEQDIKKLIDMVSEEMCYVHENYIFPLLAEEIPFRMNLEQLIFRLYGVRLKDKKRVYIEECALLESYLEIYNELKETVLDTEMVSDSIRSFQDLIAQYIDDKVICVTPRGINAYLKSDQTLSYTSETIVDWVSGETQELEIVFGDADKELSVNSLSSGECKIIMLAFYATFAYGAYLIMDEPELSISILWQQRLMRDLLDYGSFMSIIVATHSPYIPRDDSLEEYIQYLP